MILGSAIPITEAAAFTVGCMLIDARRVDPERAGAWLLALASILVLVLLIAATPAWVVETSGIAPDEVHSILE